MADESILLVDDDSEMLISLTRALKASGVSAPIHAATKYEKAMELLKEKTPQVAVLDLCLDENQGVESGFKLIKDLLAHDNTCRVIVLTGHGSIEYGVRAINLGAANFLEKPADTSHLAALINDGVKQSKLRREYTRVVAEKGSVSNSLVIGISEAVKKLHKEIEYAARSSQAILITGETGTGKGLCAKAVHVASPRAENAFIRYQANFGTADLVNSELFGHMKGAFTGANDDRKGLLAEAKGGTFFLDEIDELPLATQVTMLGVLQEKKFRPLGANKELDLDIRLICATNQDPEKCLGEGKIRKDFYHRVAHVRIHIPPLRQRKEDISLLSESILNKLNQSESISVSRFDDQAIKKLEVYDWPGNIRELEAVAEAAIHRAQFEGRNVVAAEDIQLDISSSAASELSDNSFHELVRIYKLKLIKEKLAQTNGNQLKAAEELGLDRSTMRKILLSDRK